MNVMPRISGLLGQSKTRHGTVGVLDIGTSKVVCMIANNDGNAQPTIRGIGQHASAGIKRGEVVDIAALSLAVGKAVEAAERMAGLSIERVVVGLSGAGQSSQIRTHQVDVASGEVLERDIRRLLHLDFDEPDPEGRSILHRLPIEFSLDGITGIRNPQGMFGQTLGIKMCAVDASSTALRNIRMAVERNHLAVEHYAANIYAAGLSSLLEDERDLGATVIEIGGGVTSLAYFTDGELRFIESIPLGGASITNDIARGLSIPIEEAERIKTLKGSVLAAPGDSDEMLTLPMLGQDTDMPLSVELGVLGEIIRARVEEILEMLLLRLEKAGYSSAASQRVILVGGAAQLPGMREFVSTMIGRSVRLGRPAGVIGLAEATATSAFASPVGLIHYSYIRQHIELAQTDTLISGKSGRISQIGNWFKYYIWDGGSR